MDKQKPEKNSDISNLEKAIERLKKHFLKNKHDYKIKVALSKKEAKLRKLKKYKARK